MFGFAEKEKDILKMKFSPCLEKCVRKVNKHIGLFIMTHTHAQRKRQMKQ